MPLKIYPATSIEIEKAVLYWIELLAEEKYTEAYDLTLHDPYYQWSPTDIENVINGYGLPYEAPDKKFKVTPPLLAAFDSNSNPYKDIVFYEDSTIKPHRLHNEMMVMGDICYNLPLNGEWSDLSALFKILKKDDFVMLELNDIHVL